MHNQKMQLNVEKTESTESESQTEKAQTIGHSVFPTLLA